MSQPAVLLRFVLSALVGAGVSIGAAAVTSPPPIVSTAHEGQPIDLQGLDFNLTAGTSPAPIAPLPASAAIQLTSYSPGAVTTSPTGQVQAPWLNTSPPRVPQVSQFDGGPLQGSNCLMASGAMLARLAFGIVTTGSQLRSLQDVQQGGTSLEDLETAVGRGWGVSFFKGGLSPLQLRALIYAGAGAVVSGLYGEVPVDLRLSKDFTGGHAVYVDAFRPPGPDGPAAYYVMDPIGLPSAGYDGAWWPAEVVEQFALVHYGDNLIHAAWAFPGGAIPANHPVLPAGAYPTGSEIPGQTYAPGQTPTPAQTFSVGFNPVPPGNTTLPTDPPTGDPPPHPPITPPLTFVSGAFDLEPGTTDCTVDPRPSACPAGVVGIVGVNGAFPAGSSPPQSLDLLYANLVSPGEYQIVFTTPSGSTGDLQYWGTGGALQNATVEPAVVGGQSVSVATVTVDPTASFSFVATAAGDATREMSPVGQLTVGQ
ncbi:MAG TPA: hypothetical protein VKR30_02675 [Candidatus Limnocylindrales bacterium]|nr:hypothetical protein [Candidatus Limnocylindrales bacterium]